MTITDNVSIEHLDLPPFHGLLATATSPATLEVKQGGSKVSHVPITRSKRIRTLKNSK